MADVSIMSMIAGFLPASSDSAPHSPTATSTKPRATAAAAAGESSTAGDGGATTYRRFVHMICFSKDRAFQLDQLLESSKRHLQLVQEEGAGRAGEGQEPAQLCVSVLYVASAAPWPDAAVETPSEGDVAEEVVSAAGSAAAPSLSGSGRTMEESYDIVRRRHPDVRFVRERPGEFCGQLCSLVREETGDPAPGCTGDKHAGGEERFVLFAVDDMFFYGDFELPGALELLSTDPSTFCVHLRLHPGITWSHTAGAPCHVPPLSPSGKAVTPSQRPFAGRLCSGSGDANGHRGSAGEDATSGATPGIDETRERKMHSILAADFGLLTFTREEGTGEWNYPWDLTGGLYRRGDAVAVTDGIVSTYGSQAAANPNLLEYHGHVLLQRKGNLQPRSTEVASRGTETSGGDISPRGEAPASVLSPSSSSSEPSRLSPSQATATTDSPTAGDTSSASSPQPQKPQQPAPRVDEDSADTPPAPPGTGGVTPVAAGAALSAAVNAARAAPRCGCPGRAVVSSIAVNRVQSTYSTPVYASRGGGTADLDRRLRLRRGPPSSSSEATAGNLAGAGGGGRERDGVAAAGEGGRERDTQSAGTENDAAGGGVGRDGCQGGGLDGQAYCRRVFNSVHVGELWFERDGEAGGEGERGPTAVGTTARRGGLAETGSTTGRGSGGETEQQRSNANTVTVLLPVRDGGEQLVDAVESVLSCAREMPSGWSVDLLIVDDGSEDGAVEAVVAAVTHAVTTVAVGAVDSDAVRGQTGLGCGPEGGPAGARGARPGKDTRTIAGECVVERSGSPAGAARDDSGGVFASGRAVPHGVSSRACRALPGTLRSQGGVTIRVLRHERSLGVAESLNEGLREARSDLVARMDADDVCMPGRLKQQVAFMLEHPRVSVLGTSVATFSGKTVRESGDGIPVEGHQPRRPPRRDPTTTGAVVHLPVSRVQRIARHPTDPAFTAWSMLFGCCLAHPSAMLRRDRVLEVGGYDATTEPAEDYDLWLRMQHSAPGCVANLGEVLLGLRKHDQNVSHQRRHVQHVAADAAAARAMTRLLTAQQGSRRVVTRGQAAVVRRPETATGAGDLADAARLLGDLGAEAVATEALEPGRAACGDTGALTTKAVPRSPDADNSCDAVGDMRQDEEEHGCEQQRRGRDMVARDVEARLGAMGVHAMSRFGAEAAPVVDEWRKRFPDRPLFFSLGGGR